MSRTREQLGLPSAGLRLAHWRASGYRMAGEPGGEPDNPWRVEAEPKARWQDYDPLQSYESPRPIRQRSGMLHLELLKAWTAARERGVLEPMQELASSFGLLGLERRYFDLMRPLLPEDKQYVAPEAVMLESGELIEVDPETEGRVLLGGMSDIAARMNDAKTGERWRKLISATGLSDTVDPGSIASPDELHFHATGEYGPDPLPSGPGPVSYLETLKAVFGAVLVADLDQPAGVRVLATTEPAWAWSYQLEAFRYVTDSLDSGSGPDELALAREMLEEELAGVSLGLGIGETSLRYRCRDPFQAAYLMLLMDREAGRKIKPCATADCPHYFRAGRQPSDHCSKECASRSSSRAERGRRTR